MELIISCKNKIKCWFGFHLWDVLPTVFSIVENNGKLTYEVMCGRCGKRNNDISVEILLKLINTLNV